MGLVRSDTYRISMAKLLRYRSLAWPNWRTIGRPEGIKQLSQVVESWPPMSNAQFFRTSIGARIAYAQYGDGPPLVLPPPFISDLDFNWKSNAGAAGVPSKAGQ